MRELFYPPAREVAVSASKDFPVVKVHAKQNRMQNIVFNPILKQINVQNSVLKVKQMCNTGLLF